MDGKVQARIDSHRKVLYARHADVRGQTFQQVLAEGDAYLRDTKVGRRPGGLRVAEQGALPRRVWGPAF